MMTLIEFLLFIECFQKYIMKCVVHDYNIVGVLAGMIKADKMHLKSKVLIDILYQWRN